MNVRVFVTLGTDHHRFDRLVTWLDTWHRRHDDVDLVIQEGATPAPAGAQPIGMVGRDELLDHLSRADVIVCQGGPGSIADARSVGRRPIVVPRLAEFDEVVDDHQVAFCRRLHDDGAIQAVHTEAELAAALDEAVADPDSTRAPVPESPAPATAAEVARVLTRVAGTAPGAIVWRRLRRR